MGQVIAIAYGLVGLVGLALLGIGALRRNRNLVILGAAIILGLAGMWMLGLAGAGVGVLPLAFIKRGRSNISGGES